jgi:lipopolysaccharide/colanic/teichoic acid biosynthesis glycosyltransferase
MLKTKIYRVIKPGLDRVTAVLMLIALCPLLILIGCLVAMKLGRPVLFRQVRPGLGGTPFTMIKFRTMLNAVDNQGKPLPDDQRLTAFGRFLRASSLDELPEIWNILRGEMSFVGPRPLLMEYLPRYTERQFRRHDVRPGITGLAQVSGRNAISWTEKFEKDVFYVENVSLWLDCKILIATIWKVFRREGVSAQGHATMPEFTGREND